jgi:hypothetical protein
LGLFRGRLDRFRLTDFFLETFQSFPHAFADLRQFSGPEDDQHDHEDQDKLCDS